jgi:hypothetical protein
MRFGKARGAVLLLVLGACSGDCSCQRGCGEGGIDVASGVPAQHPGTSAPTGNGTAGGPPGGGSVGSAPGTTGAAGSGAAATPGSTAVAAGAGNEAAPEVLGELIAANVLAKTLPATVGDLKAPAPVLAGPTAHERRPVTNVARRYKNGRRDLYLEIIDTAQAPELRASVLKMLSDPSAVMAPSREPLVLAGSTGLTTGFPAQQASGVMALLGGRYFVNARLEGSADMQEAARLLQSMDWSALTAADGSAGHGAH